MKFCFKGERHNGNLKLLSNAVESTRLMVIVQ